MRAILIICLSLLSIQARSQATFNGWYASFNTFRIKGNVSLHLDVQTRSNDELRHVSAFLFRPGINWHFRKNMILTAGYGFISGRRMIGGTAGYSPEHRIWEQFIVNHRTAFIPVQHRLRLEQRFIARSQLLNGEYINQGNGFANRIRYFNRAIIPWSGAKAFNKGMFAAIQNEIFINLGNKAAVNGKIFDQNRFYVATGYRFAAPFDVEIGYLNHYVSGRNRAVMNGHVIQLATYLRL